MLNHIKKTFIFLLVFFNLFSVSVTHAQEIPTEVVNNIITNYIHERNPSLNYDTINYISNCIIYYSYQYNIDPLLVTALIAAESNFKADACSEAGAKGLGQLMPLTASSVGVVDVFDIQQNIEGTCIYFKNQINNFSNYDQPIETALASYNAGSTTVREYGGIPPYSETINYINKIKNIYFHLYNLL